MTRGLARTYGPKGITVNAVSPGQINTPMLLTDLDPAVYERMRTKPHLATWVSPRTSPAWSSSLRAIMLATFLVRRSTSAAGSSCTRAAVRPSVRLSTWSRPGPVTGPGSRPPAQKGAPEPYGGIYIGDRDAYVLKRNTAPIIRAWGQ